MKSKIVFEKLAKKGLTIAFAESMTGGLACYEMIQYPGASNIVKGSIVAYHPDIKKDLLKVPERDILAHGIVSEIVSTKMAIGVSNLYHADIHVGITGNAGPTLQKDTSHHEAFITILFHKNMHQVHVDLEGLSRQKAIEKTLKKLYDILDSIL